MGQTIAPESDDVIASATSPLPYVNPDAPSDLDLLEDLFTWTAPSTPALDHLDREQFFFLCFFIPGRDAAGWSDLSLGDIERLWPEHAGELLDDALQREFLERQSCRVCERGAVPRYWYRFRLLTRSERLEEKRGGPADNVGAQSLIPGKVKPDSGDHTIWT